MLKKIFKWTAIVLVSVAVILLVAGWVLVNKANKQMEKTYEVEPAMIVIPNDSVSIEHGRVWANVLCVHCHGANLGGNLFFDEPEFGNAYTANLTKGAGGIGSSYSDYDWVRAIRHGVKPNGRGIFVMPASDFNNMTDEDLGELLAYLKTIPPVDNDTYAAPQLTVLAKILMATGALGEIYGADAIDHDAANLYSIPEEPTAEYGSYLVDVFGCRLCHGQNLNGGKDPDPTAPFGPNLTRAGHLGNWSNEQFINTMRTGYTPEGKSLDINFMPWNGLAAMPNDNLTAIFSYLKSVPAQETPEEFIPKEK